MKPVRSSASLLLVPLLALLSEGRTAAAGPGGDDDEAKLVQRLGTARVSLLDGVRAVTRDGAVAISAKFEDEGRGLSLSVYTAADGLTVDAEHNRLREHAGDPTVSAWKPSAVVFEDREHVARASEQFALMRLTKLSLGDVIEKAAALHGATVFSVTPSVRDGRGVFLVRAAAQGEVISVALDLATGVPVDGRWPRTPQPPEPVPLVGTVLSDPQVGTGRWIGPIPLPLAEAAAKRVVLVASNSYG
jgi:hypothetical protein